jgi:hypothetical protein
MKNRNEIIKELYRNIQLMDVNPELLDEAVNPFKWMKSLFSKNKVSFKDFLDNLIDNNRTIKDILNNPIYDQADKDFKNAYDAYINPANVNNLGYKYDLIHKYLHLSSPSLLEKTDFLLRGLNMSYSGLSEHLTKIMSRFDSNNPQAFNQSFEDYLTSAGINNSKQREVFKRYFDIYKKYGSGRSRGLVENQSIDALTKLAKQRNFFELINFWRLTFKSINQAFKKNKSDLEIKILDKYVGYLDDLKKVTEQTDIDNITLAYKKYIDNTFRSYLMQQNSSAFNYIFKFAENLKMQNNNPAADSLEKIINDLVGSSLGQKYPGFRLTAILKSKLGGKTTFEHNFNLIRSSIRPQYPQTYNTILNMLPDKFNFLLKNKSLNRVIRTQLWGVFPNTEFLYKLIAQSKDAIANKNVKKLLVIYIKYVMYNMARNALIFIYMPAIYGLYTGLLYAFKANYPDLAGSLTPEEEELLKGSWAEDVAAVFGREFSLHIQKTFWLVDNNESVGNKILKTAATMITPPEITSFNNSVVANVAVFLGNKGIASGPDMKYESFTQLFMDTVIFKIDDIIRGLFNGATSTGAEIQAGGTEIQAGGGQIDVNDKTWRFSTTSLPTSKIVEINFPFNKTKKVIVNDRYNLDNRFFRNINNKVGVNVPNTITISSIKVVENNNTTHNFKKG